MTKRQKELIEFLEIMWQEYPMNIPANLLLDLTRLSKHHARLQERACNETVPENHDQRTEDKIRDLVEQLPGCKVIFSGDPRGCTVKLKVPSGRTNDWGAEGICVPQ